MKRRLPHWARLIVTVLNHDFCPWANRYIDWLRTPAGLLVLGALITGLCGYYLHSKCYVLMAVILAALLIGLVWPWVMLRGLRASMTYGRERVSEGESVEIKLRIRNWLPFAAWGVGFRSGGASGPGHYLDAGITCLRGWRTTELTVSFVPACRGDYPRHAAHLVSGFPFGLWQAKRTVTPRNRLLVWPRTFPVGPIPEVAGQRSHDGNVFRNHVGTSGDVLGVRPYRRGDSPRRIHWPKTASHDRLIVCELQSSALPWVQIVLDVSDAAHAGEGPDSSREWAIRIGASFAADWIGQGGRIEAVLGNQVNPAGAEKRHLRQTLDTLARLPVTHGPSLGEMLASTSCSGFDGGLRVVVTTDRGLEQAAPRLLRATSQRFVVIDVSAFKGGSPMPRTRPLPIAPWILIEKPANVPAQIRRGWKEAVCAS